MPICLSEEFILLHFSLILGDTCWGHFLPKKEYQELSNDWAFYVMSWTHSESRSLCRQGGVDGGLAEEPKSVQDGKSSPVRKSEKHRSIQLFWAIWTRVWTRRTILPSQMAQPSKQPHIWTGRAPTIWNICWCYVEYHGWQFNQLPQGL